jgi:hypothetical protein
MKFAETGLRLALGANFYIPETALWQDKIPGVP